MSQNQIEVASAIKLKDPNINQEQQSKKDVDQQIKNKFIFKPSETVDLQLTKFKKYNENGLWNGYITFKNFKGTFKLEYWATFEEEFRQIDEITGFTFKNTKLDKQHLALLRSLLQWVQPKKISLSFKRNELDDLDLEDFLIKWLLPNFGGKIKSLKIISNPGIFKGHFVSQLKQKLAIMTLQDSLYEFHFIKNKEYKSIGFISFKRDVSNLYVTNIDAEKLKFKKSLQRTCYYQLSLKECFTKENSKSLMNFIDQVYHEDQLEFIESLDIGNCNLGSEIDFIKLSKKFSTSKGLLSLGMKNQIHIHSWHLLQLLMGNRYDQLRINHLNIEENENITALSVRVLADNLMSKSLKTIDFGGLSCDDRIIDEKLANGSSSKEPNMDTKILYITDAYFRQIKVLKRIMKKGTLIKYLEQIIPKLNLKKIDLSYIDIFNTLKQPQLAKGLLDSMVLNEFSSCKELITQVLNDDQLKVQLDALNQFEKCTDQMIKSNPIYKNFIPKLESISSSLMEVMHPIETKLLVQVLQRFYFTKTTNLIQIKTLTFTRFLFIEDSDAGFIYFLKTLSIVNNSQQNFLYTLEHLTIIKIINTLSNLYLFQNIVFSRNFNLKSLILEYEITTDDDWSDMLDFGHKYLQQLDTGSFLALRKVNCKKLNGDLDVIKLVEVLVFTEKVKLSELILTNINVKYDEKSTKSLKEKVDGWISKQTIERLHLDKINKKKNHLIDHDIGTLIEVLVLHPTSSVNELFLKDVHLEKFLGELFFGSQAHGKFKNFHVRLQRNYFIKRLGAFS